MWAEKKVAMMAQLEAEQEDKADVAAQQECTKKAMVEAHVASAIEISNKR